MTHSAGTGLIEPEGWLHSHTSRTLRNDSKHVNFDPFVALINGECVVCCYDKGPMNAIFEVKHYKCGPMQLSMYGCTVRLAMRLLRVSKCRRANIYSLPQRFPAARMHPPLCSHINRIQNTGFSAVPFVLSGFRALMNAWTATLTTQPETPCGRECLSWQG